MSLILAWLRAFLLTLVTEMAVAVPLLDEREPLRRRCLAVALAQLTTHPTVWFILPELNLRRTLYLVIAEGFAVIVELLLYRLIFRGLSLSRALGISAVANGASFFLGVLLRHGGML